MQKYVSCLLAENKTDDEQHPFTFSIYVERLTQAKSDIFELILWLESTANTVSFPNLDCVIYSNFN